jgi:hypothetical protein
MFSITSTSGAIGVAGWTGAVPTDAPSCEAAARAGFGPRFGARFARGCFFAGPFRRAPSDPPPSADTSNVHVTRRPAFSGGIMILCFDTATRWGNPHAHAFLREFSRSQTGPLQDGHSTFNICCPVLRADDPTGRRGHSRCPSTSRSARVKSLPWSNGEPFFD